MMPQCNIRLMGGINELENQFNFSMTDFVGNSNVTGKVSILKVRNQPDGKFSC